eukprot:TRINITY_DN36088_c0_g1_i1.p1 TRINITY_DN36088_c0_g1~~TRINITY_DN36088_c0_g1_i1.p1  ORF type:complete len:328 (+),score=98.02 TRINITY_DN36088_c0_g1_i1:87-986(+)
MAAAALQRRRWALCPAVLLQLVIPGAADSIVHVVNPFACPEGHPSQLQRFGPITLQSMLRAKRQAEQEGGARVTLVAAVFTPADAAVVPGGFQVRRLRRSLRDFLPSEPQRPLLADLLAVAMESAPPAALAVLTNYDIALLPDFYLRAARLARGRSALSITRLNGVPAQYRGVPLSADRLEDAYAAAAHFGTSHLGHDCFVIRREVVPQLRTGNVVVGLQPWGVHLLRELRRACFAAVPLRQRRQWGWQLERCPAVAVLRNLTLTFHIGRTGRINRTAPAVAWNRRAAEAAAAAPAPSR